MKTHYQNEAAWRADYEKLMANRSDTTIQPATITRKYITGAEPKTSRAKLHYSAPQPIRRTR